MSELRDWQNAALARFLRQNDDFLCVATPGAGKTTFALSAAQRLIERGEIQRVIVVVHTKHLQRQWALAAARLGIQLDYTVTNGVGALAKDFDGAAVTYATVASEQLLWRKHATAVPTLVVLDEVHHAGEKERLKWGAALKRAFESAARRLLLSGTPFREDGAPIPFVRYGEGERCVPDYNYDYGTALQDGGVVRPIAFLALDGTVRWREAGRVVATDLVDAEGDSLSNALGSALNPGGDWIASVLRKADAELARHRDDVPDAGGLIIAANQKLARAYQAIMQSICGELPDLAISDEPDASDVILRFAAGTSRWLIAVQMVSEGVDIPRLAVGVYGSRVRTEMFFRQVVGRFVRMRGPEDETMATLLIPSIEPLLGYAQEIERTIERTLREDEQRVREATEKTIECQMRLELVEPLDSSEAVYHSTILSGQSFTDDELRRAQEVMQLCAALPGSLRAEHVSQILRAAGLGRVVGTAVVTQPAVPLADQKVPLRRLINRKVGHLAVLTETPHKHIHYRLNQYCRDTVPTATVETLNQRLTVLDQWIDESS